MRSLFVLLALSLLALPSQAQSVADATTTTKPAHPHLTMQQRFEQANVTHDGHLTEDQAKNAYKSVARHFASIDQDKKGYITEDDIRAYYKTQRALHHPPQAASHAYSN
ncbi:MAG TPA: EF-hand domain-containing protein [Acetobacteraceae bacterium]|jgi:threonine aldolase|nr:EF-hand domain-containing protein [Acetobacteraceae bacterium]